MNIKNSYLVYGEPQIGYIKGEASMKEYNFSNMNFEELTNLRTALEQEFNTRKEQEFNRLVKNVCKAIAELRSVFPYFTFNVSTECSDCAEFTTANVFSYGTETIAPHFFSMH